MPFEIDQASAEAIPDWMDMVTQRILDGVRAGMAEGMVLLAENTVDALHEAGVQNRTGILEQNILGSPRVTEGARYIRGRVKALAPVKKQGGELYYNNLGNILNLGFTDPAVKSPMHQIVEPDGGTFWARGHVAFDVKPHPFFRQAMAVSESPIMEIIRQRVAEAEGEV